MDTTEAAAHRSIDVRQTLWDSASAIANHIRHQRKSSLSAPAELEFKFNGGVSPNVARHYARILAAGSLPQDARILDLGCGYGRIAMELARNLGPDQKYYGLDPNADGLIWARQNITSQYPNCSFEWIDIHSRPYNPDGEYHGRDFRFPFDDASLDLVFMVSVLAHVDLATVENYIREAGRTLKPETGRLVATFFLLDEEIESLIAEGKSYFTLPFAYGRSRVQIETNPELVIAHPRQTVIDMLADAGFASSSLLNGHWSGRAGSTMDFQDLLMADRAPGAVHIFDPQPAPAPTPARDDSLFQHNIVEQLARFGYSRQKLMEFVTWSASVTLNVLRWQDAGLALALTSDGQSAAQPLQLNLAPLRDAGLAAPTPAGAVPDAQFIPMDDNGLITALVAAEGINAEHDILACMFAAAENGLLLLAAQREGWKFELLSSQPVQFPAFAS